MIVGVILPSPAALALAGDGVFTVTNNTVPNFPIWAREAGYRIVAGDFNGDGKDDIAMTGATSATTIPVAFSTGNGNFTVTNNTVPNFPIWARETGYRIVAGDFNGDGKDDIAVTGATSATTIPVAFSGVAVNLHLGGSYGSVSIRVNGSLTGTCSVADCFHAVPVGSTVQLTPDGDVTSWGSGPCQNVAGSASCSFTALSDNTFQVNFLG